MNSGMQDSSSNSVLNRKKDPSLSKLQKFLGHQNYQMDNVCQLKITRSIAMVLRWDCGRFQCGYLAWRENWKDVKMIACCILDLFGRVLNWHETDWKIHAMTTYSATDPVKSASTLASDGFVRWLCIRKRDKKLRVRLSIIVLPSSNCIHLAVWGNVASVSFSWWDDGF